MFGLVEEQQLKSPQLHGNSYTNTTFNISALFYCLKPCSIQCRHCCAILTFFGQKHQSPVVDEGFYDDDDIDIQVCEDGDKNLY